MATEHIEIEVETDSWSSDVRYVVPFDFAAFAQAYGVAVKRVRLLTPQKRQESEDA